MRQIIVPGIVVYHIDLMCTNSGTSVDDDARSVVSESGLILSPKNAPDITAPAAIPTGMPRPADIPQRTTPIVLIEPQLVPVHTAMNAGSMKQIGRKSFGVIIFMP